MKLAFSAMLNPTQGWALSQNRGAKTSPVGAIVNRAAQAVRRDSASFSEEGRKQASGGNDGFLKSLIERKTLLQDRRKALLRTAAQDGTQSDLIRNQIKDIDKQLAEVNQQMSDYLLQKQKEALEEESGRKQEELTPEEARAKQMENVAAARESLDRSEQLGVTRAVLKRSRAYAAEWEGNSYAQSPLGMEVSRQGYASTIEKLDQGITGLENAQRDLLANAQELTEENIALSDRTTQSEPKPEEAAGENAAQKETEPEPDTLEELREQEQQEETRAH